MITQAQCTLKYGLPDPKSKWMTLWDVPEELEIGIIPRRIYCNTDLVHPLTRAFTNLIATGRVVELRTWDGCYNIRPMRGYEKRYKDAIAKGDDQAAAKCLSIHSWGLAVDVNAFENGLNQEPKLSPAFVKCFTDAGFDWGGIWKRKDGMHFQLARI